MRAVVLAGGQGARLLPYTTIMPKPLMPVGDFPIAEIVVRQLRYYGVDEIVFAVGHLHQLVEAYFGDGSRWDVKIDYLREEHPLGTAGPLSRLTKFDEPLLVLNGDNLTDLDFAEFWRSHSTQECDMTIATFTKRLAIDLGVIRSDAHGKVTDYIEKPQQSFRVSMGVYMLSPAVVHYIPENRHCDFSDLVKLLLSAGRQVRAYTFEGLWLDMGRTEDYFNAAEIFERYRSTLLPTSGAIPGVPFNIDVSP